MLTLIIPAGKTFMSLFFANHTLNKPNNTAINSNILYNKFNFSSNKYPLDLFGK